MSCNYAEGLSDYAHKGKLGLPEKFDSDEQVEQKVAQLAEWVRESKHVVVHTGAGISTSAGIPDFRGPKGVWTLEKKGEKPKVCVSWNDAVPTKTHMALAELTRTDRVKFVVSQNIDGMHMRTGMRRSKLAEVHGNMFVDQCNACKRQFVRGSAAETVGQKVSEVGCPGKKGNGRACRGKLADFVLDWEDELPDDDLDLSDAHSCLSDLSIVMGSTLQIVPAGNLPTYAKKHKADLIIHSYVDDVMERLFALFDMTLPDYDPAADPTRRVGESFIEWTQCGKETKVFKARADKLDTEFKLKRKLDRLKKKSEQVEAVKEEDVEPSEAKASRLEQTKEEENGASCIKEDVKEEVKVESKPVSPDSNGAES
jgi:mono-ADP-ribosyltransferase sirtuin 6